MYLHHRTSWNIQAVSRTENKIKFCSYQEAVLFSLSAPDHSWWKKNSVRHSILYYREYATYSSDQTFHQFPIKKKDITFEENYENSEKLHRSWQQCSWKWHWRNSLNSIYSSPFLRITHCFFIPTMFGNLFMRTLLLKLKW